MGELAPAQIGSAVHIRLEVNSLVIVGTQENEVLVLVEPRAIAVEASGPAGLASDNVCLFSEDQPRKVGAVSVNSE